MMTARKSLLSLGSALLALTSTFDAVAQSRPTLEETFAHPAKADRPMVRWWWPGNNVDDAEIARQIALLDEAGLGGAEVQPIALGLTGLSAEERAAVQTYAEPSFFGHFRAAATAAKARGMWLDYNLGSAWPAGGGFAITPEKALLELTMAATTVEGGRGGPIKVTIPSRTSRLGAFSPLDVRWKVPEAADWPARLDARAKIVAVVAMRGGAPELVKAGNAVVPIKLSAWSDVKHPGALDLASTVVLTDRLSPDGTLDWTPPPGTWQVMVFKQYGVNSSVTGSAGKGPQLVADHFDPAGFAAHVRRVGDPMVAALGPSRSAVRSTFLDSFELMGDLPWSERFLSEFRRRRGYDLTPYLPFVIQPGWMQAWGERYSPPYYVPNADTSVGERIRTDYRRTVSDLMIDAFLSPFVEWNHAHGLLAKLQAHGAPSDLIRSYGLADIPETENLKPDWDTLEMRFARSAANIYGRKLVSAEALAIKDRPFDPTPAWLRQRIDMFIAAGVNAETFHGYPYSPSGKWPGWFPFAPTPFNPGFGTLLNQQNPIWAAMPTLAGYTSRLNAIMRQGRSQVPVALFYGQIGYYHGIEDEGRGDQLPQKTLLASGYDFDRINAHGLMGSRVEGRELVTPGGHHYEALVFPASSSLDPDVAEKVAAFAKSGLPVTFIDRQPDRADGFLNAAQADARVRAAIARLPGAGGRITSIGDLATRLRSDGVSANLQLDGDTADIAFVERRIGKRRLYFVFNGSDAPRQIGVTFPVSGGVQRWDANDGSISEQSARARTGATSVRLSLDPHRGTLLVLDPARRAREVTKVSYRPLLELPQTGWQLDAVGYVARDQESRVSQSDWTLRDLGEGVLSAFAGRVRYVRDFDVSTVMTKGRVMLNLGSVHDAAIVTINGKRFQPLIDTWRLDVTQAIRAGRNRIEVDVYTVPQNALRSKAPGYNKLPEVQSGLIGPVLLEAPQ